MRVFPNSAEGIRVRRSWVSRSSSAEWPAAKEWTCATRPIRPSTNFLRWVRGDFAELELGCPATANSIRWRRGGISIDAPHCRCTTANASTTVASRVPALAELPQRGVVGNRRLERLARYIHASCLPSHSAGAHCTSYSASLRSLCDVHLPFTSPRRRRALDAADPGAEPCRIGAAGP